MSTRSAHTMFPEKCMFGRGWSIRQTPFYVDKQGRDIKDTGAAEYQVFRARNGDLMLLDLKVSGTMRKGKTRKDKGARH